MCKKPWENVSRKIALQKNSSHLSMKFFVNFFLSLILLSWEFLSESKIYFWRTFFNAFFIPYVSIIHFSVCIFFELCYLMFIIQIRDQKCSANLPDHLSELERSFSRASSHNTPTICWLPQHKYSFLFFLSRKLSIN